MKISASSQRGGRLRAASGPVLTIAAAIALWQLAVTSGVVPRQEVPSAASVAAALGHDLHTAFLWSSLGQTLYAWGLGLVIVTAVAIPVGTALGASELGYRLTSASLEVIRMVPSIAALPILALLYGTGLRLTLVMVMLTAVWPLLIQATYGVRDVDPVTREMGRVYGLSRPRLFTRITLPSALPYLATGLRLSATTGLLTAIAASLITGSPGLGNAIAFAAATSAYGLMYARIAVTGALGLIATAAFTALERRTIHWHSSWIQEQA